MLVGMVVAEMAGVFVVTRLVEEEARRARTRHDPGARQQNHRRRGASLWRCVGAPRVGARDPAGWQDPRADRDRRPRRAGVVAVGIAAEWERRGQPVAGPVTTTAGSVLVAYQPLADGRVIRAVVPVSGAGTVGRWRSVGALLGLAVALGGGLVAWALIARVLAPYRELLAEAVRVTGGPRDEAEDKFLVETFRDTVRRLEESEAALRRRADELEVLAGVLTRGSSAGS